jgi:hypothetical protein
VKEGADLLHQVSVQHFRDSVVLQSVMCGEPLLCPVLLVECLEGVAGVLAPTVRAKTANRGTMLCAHPCEKCLVGVCSIGLGFHSFYQHVPRVIISECDVVLLPTDAFGG